MGQQRRRELVDFPAYHHDLTPRRANLAYRRSMDCDAIIVHALALACVVLLVEVT